MQNSLHFKKEDITTRKIKIRTIAVSWIRPRDCFLFLEAPLKNHYYFDKGGYCMRKRLFVDMDGTIAEYPRVEAIEEYWQEGHYFNLKPIDNFLEGVRQFIKENPNVDVYILSAVHPNTTAIAEKNAWLDIYLPEIDVKHRIFTECGKPKDNYIKGGVCPSDVLFDDYTKNLNLWKGVGVKALNGINHSSRSWTGSQVSYERSASSIAECLSDVLNNKYVRDEKPDIQLRIENEENVYIGEDVLKNVISEHFQDFSLKAFLTAYRPEDVKRIQELVPDAVKVERLNTLASFINDAKGSVDWSMYKNNPSKDLQL